jgi:hypothetical protein
MMRVGWAEVRSLADVMQELAGMAAPVARAGS